MTVRDSRHLIDTRLQVADPISAKPDHRVWVRLPPHALLPGGVAIPGGKVVGGPSKGSWPGEHLGGPSGWGGPPGHGGFGPIGWGPSKHKTPHLNGGMSNDMPEGTGGGAQHGPSGSNGPPGGWSWWVSQGGRSPFRGQRTGPGSGFWGGHRSTDWEGGSPFSPGMRKVPDLAPHSPAGVGHSNKLDPEDPGPYRLPTHENAHQYADRPETSGESNSSETGHGLIGWMRQEDARYNNEVASAEYDKAMSDWTLTRVGPEPQPPPHYIKPDQRKYVHFDGFRPGDDDNVGGPRARTWSGRWERPAPDDVGPGVGPRGFGAMPNPDDPTGGGPRSRSMPNPDDLSGGGIGPRSRIWMRR